MKKSPPLYLWPLMISSALAAIVIGCWAVDRAADMKGQHDEVLQHLGRDRGLP
jgi:hypothetical protein